MSRRSTRELAHQINDLIEYFRMEFMLTYAEAIGVLELAKGRLVAEANEEDDEDDHESA